MRRQSVSRRVEEKGRTAADADGSRPGTCTCLVASDVVIRQKLKKRDTDVHVEHGRVPTCAQVKGDYFFF